MTTGNRKTAADYSREHAKRRIRVNAADLRRLADTFDRIADDLDRVPGPGQARATEVAGRIISEHAAWLSNAHMETGIGYAAEFDLYRATGE